MKLEIWEKDFSLQWSGVYHLALVDYPNIQEWEKEKIAAFIAYEKLNHRITEIICRNSDLYAQLETLPRLAFPFTPSSNIVASTFNSDGKLVYSNLLSHTCTKETAKSIFKSGKLLSAVNAFRLPKEQLKNETRNAAGDPEDYFDYVMFTWSNTTSGYRLAMERLLERMLTDDELGKAFIPGVSFHFQYKDILSSDGYIFDGYHAAKVKDELNLDKLFACVIPQSEKHCFKDIIPPSLLSKVYYLDYENDGLVSWSQKVYRFVKNLPQ